MLITNRTEFEEMVQAVSRSGVIAFDTETNGTRLRNGHRVVGISVYTDWNAQTYYLPIAHGYGTVIDTPFQEMKRWSDDKKRAYAEHIYKTELVEGVQALNMPLKWLDELKAVWLNPHTHVAHNAAFDLTALGGLGFPQPLNVQDTMVMLSVVNPDWSGDPDTGTVPKYLMPDTGQYEEGGRGLKWQARLWNLEGAKLGIDELSENVIKLNLELKRLGTEFSDKADLGLTFSKKSKHPPAAFIWMLKPEQVSLYAEDDTRLTYLLWVRINGFLENWGDIELGIKYNKFLTKVTYPMEVHGFKLNLDRIEMMIQTNQVEQVKLQEEIAQLTHGIVHNPSSPPQVLSYLNAIGLNVKSSAKAELAKISGVPALDLITHYRKMVTLQGVIEKWRDNNVHGYIHPEIRPGAASTGRGISGSEEFGNLQNVARVDEKDTVQPKKVLFSPAPGTLLFDVDYQALEIRVGAWIAETLIGDGKDLTLTKLVEADEDMHSYTMEVSGVKAIILRGLSPADWLRKNGYNVDAIDDPEGYFIKKIARFKAKTTNFAAMYGAGVRGIVKAVGCTTEEAEVLLKGFHRAYPAIGKAMDYLQRLAVKPRRFNDFSNEVAQYIKYPIEGLQLKRKYHYYPTLAQSANGGTWNPQQSASRGAFNSMVQGTGGLIMYNSILNLHERFGVASYEWWENFSHPTEGVAFKRVYDFSEGLIVPCTTVHDSNVFAVQTERAQEVIPVVREIFTDYDVRPKLDVGVDYSESGSSWGGGGGGGVNFCQLQPF